MFRLLLCQHHKVEELDIKDHLEQIAHKLLPFLHNRIGRLGGAHSASLVRSEHQSPPSQLHSPVYLTFVATLGSLTLFL